MRLEIERLGDESDFAGDVDPSCVVNGHALILPSTIIISSKDGVIAARLNAFVTFFRSRFCSAGLHEVLESPVSQKG